MDASLSRGAMASRRACISVTAQRCAAFGSAAHAKRQAAILAGGGAPTPWYLAGGAPTPIAVYQPKAAASLAASYVNLANPGTHDLTVLRTAPTFNASLGWSMFYTSATDYSVLDTGIAPSSQNWTYIVRARVTSRVAAGAAYFFGCRVLSPTSIVLLRVNNVSDVISGGNCSGYTNTTGTLALNTWGTLCLAGDKIFLNGSDLGVTLTNTGVVPTPTIVLNAINVAATDLGGIPQNALTAIDYVGFVMYDSVLSSGQVAAVAAAMAAL